MSDRWSRIARAIDSFVENPITNLVKGVASCSSASPKPRGPSRKTFTESHLRVGHGLVIIGFFGILEALPHLIDGLEAGKRYAELRATKEPTEAGFGRGPRSGKPLVRT